MWRAIREAAEIEWLRHDAERRLAQLDALDQLDLLQKLVDRYVRETGRPAGHWSDLERARLIRAQPVDPSGASYEIGPGGLVRLSTASPLWPLPQEPARLDPPQPS